MAGAEDRVLTSSWRRGFSNMFERLVADVQRGVRTLSITTPFAGCSGLRKRRGHALGVHNPNCRWSRVTVPTLVSYMAEGCCVCSAVGCAGGALGVWRSGFRSWHLSLADAGGAPHGSWRLGIVQPFHGPFGCEKCMLPPAGDGAGSSGGLSLHKLCPRPCARRLS